MPDVRKVLVVEDDETIRNLIRLYLVRYPLAIYDAKDGLDGLAIAIQIIPDLIITDLSMPRMDGLTFLAAVKVHEKLKAIPVIVVSGMDATYHIKAMEAGASAVLQKPITHAMLRQAISVFLPLAR